jgi:hypothetical protein
MSDFDFNWNGDEIEREVMDAVDKTLMTLGGFLVEHMQGYAPVDTGALRTSIVDQYDPATHTLTIHIGMAYGVYQELGTRNIPPHPFIRPSIIDATAHWNITDVTLIINPPVLSPTHLRASTSGFRIPKGANLNAKQLHHVKTKLRPTSRSFASKFKRRKINFRIQGPGDAS